VPDTRAYTRGVRVAITGGTGFVGRRLCEALCDRGDEVIIMTRRAAGDAPSSRNGSLPKGARAVGYDPKDAGSIAEHVEGMDAVVHLAGEAVAQRWNDEVKRRIVESRVDTTRALVAALKNAKQRPAVFVSASAIGYYGPRPGDELLDEASAPGSDFLADVVRQWEREAERAEALGIRVVRLRIGIVLGPGGGALQKMALPFKLGVGGPIGDGRQVVSWVHLDDVVGLCLLSLDDARASGPINAVAPNPVTNRELSKAIGRALHRPAWLPVPRFAVGLALGEAADAVTTGQRVLPERARELGYPFRHATVDDALQAAFAAT
jgi:uncharacterized protein